MSLDDADAQLKSEGGAEQDNKEIPEGTDKDLTDDQEQNSQELLGNSTGQEASDKHDEVISVEAVENEIAYNPDIPCQLVDLLKETPLKFSDSTGSKITFIEAWELNLYIGTSLGEIIHLYKIDDDLGYIQISKQKFSSTSSKPIRKIVILSEISICLVHCGSTVSGYLLPELSPANIGKAKDVNDISIDWGDLEIDSKKHNKISKTEDYHGDAFSRVTIFTRKSIKLLRIFCDGIRLHREIQYADISKGLQVSNFSIVANSDNYELVDVSQVQRIFLFPLSTNISTSILKPIIEYVSKNEIFLVCGGSNDTDSAVGMFINLKGDVVRGTLTFESYPSSVSVEYPYIFAIFKGKIIIYSIFDQKVLQQIEFGDTSELAVFGTSRIFEIEDPELVKNIMQAPIVSTMDNDEIERIVIESDNAIKKAVCHSSCIVVDTAGKHFKILKPIADVERWVQLYKSTTNESCQNVYDKFAEDFSRHKSNIFLITLMGFFTLHYGLYNQAFEIWTSNFKYLDPRLMIYMFGKDGSDGIFGSVWTYRILFDQVEEIKKSHKSEEIQDFLKLYFNTCLTKDFEKNTALIKKSVEVALVKLGIESGDDLEPVVYEIKHANNEIIELLLLSKKYFVLSRFYANLKDHRQFLYYWKGLIDGEFVDEEFDKNFKDKKKSLQFLINYIFSNCIDDKLTIENYSEWLLKSYPSFGLKLVTDNRIKKLEINDIKVLNLLNSSEEKEELKLQYLEYIFENKNEKQFIGDLISIYLNLVVNEYIKNPKIRGIIDTAMDRYSQMEIPKMTIYKYWNLIEETELKNTLFSVYHNKLYSYINLGSIGMKSILDQQAVIERCRERIVESDEMSNSLPLLDLVILFKYEDYEGIVERFIKLKDYTSAEEFAVSLNIGSLSEKTPVQSARMENMATNSSLINDETPVKTQDNLLTEKLLKNIFDVYLKLGETRLIDRFLNKYDLLDDNTETSTSTIDRMDKFVNVINRVPDSFPLDRLKRFLVNNLIEFKDYNDHITMKKSLVKLEVSRMVQLEQNCKKN